MIRLAPLSRDRLRDLIEDFESCRKELVRLVACSKKDFERDRDLYATTEHYFRRALEGILTGGTRILSRLPVETKDYTEVITELGTKGIITADFAQRNKGLAGYRNRLFISTGKFLLKSSMTRFMSTLMISLILQKDMRRYSAILRNGV